MAIRTEEQKGEILSASRAPQRDQVDSENRGLGLVSSANQMAAVALAVQAKELVRARFAQARDFPRDPDQVRQHLLRCCANPRFAEVAMYSLPGRGGSNKPITGMSIQFVQAALREMGNTATESVVIFDDQERRLIRVTVSDLETNTTFDRTIVLQKTVERKKLRDGQQALAQRVNSFGDVVYIVEASEDDLATKEAALTSKLIRSLGLRLVDGGMLDECRELIEKIIEDRAAKDPDGERKRLIDGFFQMGIRVEDLKAYTGTDMQTLDPATLKHLRQIWTALRDGQTTWAEIIEAREAVLGKKTDQAPAGTTAGSRTSGLKDSLKQKGQKAAAAESKGSQHQTAGGDAAQTKSEPVSGAVTDQARPTDQGETDDLFKTEMIPVGPENAGNFDRPASTKKPDQGTEHAK
jgi:hypothetical protein